MSKNKYPAKEGWIRAELTMKTKEMVPEQDIKTFFSAGQPHRYEFGPIEQYGAKIKAVYRQKPITGSEVAA